MPSNLISALRSAAIAVPDLARAEQFYTQVWRLQVVARSETCIHFAGTGRDHHLLAVHLGGQAASIRYVTLRACSLAALEQVSTRCVAAGGKLLQALHTSVSGAGGQSILIQDPDGRRFEIVYGDQVAETAREQKDVPVRLAHVVLNSHAVDDTKAFMEAVLDFRLIDRTGIMAFMNCNDDHHSLAIGITDNDALNHIAFVMPDLESVMRGGGRMRDAGHPIEWGPGRHGPGDNAFNYFIDPFGVVIEYTAEVEQVSADYKVGMPTDWKWPVGRVDQWGISAPPSANLKLAQKRVLFEA
jgi:catechol 2,3-dioxygenase-like lactoylglutathione lyase family enzyme